MSVQPRLIAHVIHRLDVGGLENGLVNLVNRIPPERYRHAILCLSGFSEAFRDRIRRPDVEVISLDKQPGKDPAVYLRMWRQLRRRRPDILHTRNLGTVDMQWIGVLAGVTRRVHGEHGWEGADPRGLNPRSLSIRRACRPAIQRYVAMSQDIARWLEQQVGVPARLIRQLYSGVDSERFTPQGPRPADRPWAGEAGDPPIVIGTLGRLDPVKDQASLLSALRLLSDQEPALAPRLRLVIAGAGPSMGALVALASELGLSEQVWFAGGRDDTADLLRTLDVFVLPSLNEGISNTILEAMATGLPVVATTVGGNPELVVDSVTGRLVPAQDPRALAAALRDYVTDPSLRQAHGTAGRARVVQNFSLDAMVARYLALYDELIAHG